MFPRLERERGEGTLKPKLRFAVLLLLASSPAAPRAESAAGDACAVVFYSGRSDNEDVYILHPGEKQPRNLTQHPAADLCPAPSPDGKRIAFLSDRDGNTDIYSMTVTAPTSAGSRPRGDRGAPRVHPDGKRLLFIRDFETRTEIWVMDADGTNPRRLTSNEARDERPFLSPAGDRIVFMSNRDGNYDIYTMAARRQRPAAAHADAGMGDLPGLVARRQGDRLLPQVQGRWRHAGHDPRHERRRQRRQAAHRSRHPRRERHVVADGRCISSRACATATSRSTR